MIVGSCLVHTTLSLIHHVRKAKHSKPSSFYTTADEHRHDNMLSQSSDSCMFGPVTIWFPHLSHICLLEQILILSEANEPCSSELDTVWKSHSHKIDNIHVENRGIYSLTLVEGTRKGRPEMPSQKF